MLGPAEFFSIRYACVAAAVVGQWLTVVISWPLWQLRDRQMPNLPQRFYEAMGGPEFDFAWPMILSAALVLLLPRAGVWIHGAVLLWACLADEMRTQPQFIALWLLMFAASHQSGIFWGQWFLASMWFWAGLHKLLSPEWFTSAGWWVYSRAGGQSPVIFPLFAGGTGLFEMLIGVLAVVRPRIAAGLCLLMHTSIAIFLTPLFLNWNFSVIPWNLVSGLVGCWILWHAESGIPRAMHQRAIAAAWMLYPIGFFFGWVDHGIGHVLYSANVPQGIITTEERAYEIYGWKEINVPFPNERRTLAEHFRRAARIGDKLHIREPRPWLGDLYFELGDGRELRPLGRDEFLAENRWGRAGRLVDGPIPYHRLLRAGVRLLARPGDSYIYAAEISPAIYRRDLLALLRGLPNLEQLQLAGTAVIDDDLAELVGLHRLAGLGLDRTKVTDRCLPILKQLPSLRVVEHAETELSADALESQTAAQSAQ